MPKDKRDPSTTDHREKGDRRDRGPETGTDAREEYTGYHPEDEPPAVPEEAEAAREAELQPSEEDTEGVEPDR